MLAHVADVADMLAGIAHLLDDDGIAVIEVQYLPDLLVNNAFDLVYRITSYNVCYTKLLRTPVTSFSVIAPGLIAEGIWLKLSASYPAGWGGFRIPTGGAYGQIVCQGSCTRRPISGLVETSVVMYFDRIQAMRVGNVGAEVTG